MQMFVLSHDPHISAQYFADVHVRVICREISMCLSSWYYKNIGEHAEELPYRAFNHPVIDQFDNPYTRKWAIMNADAIFTEFERRFNKEHASKAKYEKICDYYFKYDEIYGTFYYKYGMQNVTDKATFSFVEKDRGVIKDLPTNEAVKRYKEYYKNKLNTMKVPVTYTETYRPEWSI